KGLGPAVKTIPSVTVTRLLLLVNEVVFRLTGMVLPGAWLLSLPGCGTAFVRRKRMTMMDWREEKKRPEGGYCLISVGAMLECWKAYRHGPIEYRDLRVWFAAHELAARRCRLAKGRTASYRLEELAGLVGGAGGEHFRLSLRRLEASGLL